MDYQALGKGWPVGTTPGRAPRRGRAKALGRWASRFKASADMGRGLMRSGKQGLGGDISEPPTQHSPW